MNPRAFHRKSPIQIALLSIGARGPIPVTEARKRLEQHFKDQDWIPHRGVIYPALKRLHQHGLIVLSERYGLKQFHTSQQGLSELLRITNHFLTRLDNQVELILLSIENFLDMDPMNAKNILAQLQEQLTRYLEQVTSLKEKATTAEAEWIDIKLEDEKE